MFLSVPIMRLLGIVSILMFLSFLVANFNLLLFYLSPFIHEVECYVNDFLHQCTVRSGLIFIGIELIIATILSKSSILSPHKVSAGYITCELCFLDDNDDDEGEFSVQEMKQDAVLEKRIYGIEEIDAYSKVDEEIKDVSENVGVSGNNVNVKADHTSVDENPSGDEIKEKVEQEKMQGIRVEDGESNEDFEILESRIEEFIARSHQRWKQELLEEKYNQLAIGNDNFYYLTSGVITEAQQRKANPRISRPKNVNYNRKIGKRQRFQTIRRLIQSMQTKAKMITKSNQYAITTRKGGKRKKKEKCLINGI